MASEFKHVGNVTVIRYQIIGTRMFVHAAYEPTVLGSGGHSTITSGGDYGRSGWLGRLGTGPVPEAIAVLPAYSDERSAAYRAWRAEQDARSYGLIVEAFPQAACGRQCDGEIETYEPAV